MPVQHDQAEAAPARWSEADTHPASASSARGAKVCSDPMDTRMASPCIPVLEEVHLWLADAPVMFPSSHQAEEVLPHKEHDSAATVDAPPGGLADDELFRTHLVQAGYAILPMPPIVAGEAVPVRMAEPSRRCPNGGPISFFLNGLEARRRTRAVARTFELV